MLVLGAAAGVLWFWIADPGYFVVTEVGAGRSENEARAKFEVIVQFTGIGALFSLGWGAAAGHVLRRFGWVLVPVFAAAASLAGLITWRVGVALGPPDPREAVDLTLGDRIPAQLEIDAVAPFLVWPMFALLGLLVAAWLDRSGADEYVDA